MRALSKIPSNKVVALDIETARITRTFSEAGEDIKTAWAYKNKNEGEYPDEMELEQLWQKKSALYPEFAKIISVSLTYTNKEGTRLICENLTSDNEVLILTELANRFNQIFRVDPNYVFIGHAAKHFDYPFIAKRMIINNIPIPGIIDHSDKKPWEIRNLDSNELWKMGGMSGTSLVAMCAALGVPISKDEMAGEDVGTFFYEGELDKIATYCNKDTISLFNCLRRMKGEPIFRFEDVAYMGAPDVEDQTVVSTQVEKMPCLNLLYTTKDFSEEIQEEIRDRFLNRGKKVMKKEFKMLQKVLNALYINTEMFKSDSPDVVASKKVEVEEFINQLEKDHNGKKSS